MNRTLRKAIIFIASAVLVVALCIVGLLLANRSTMADSGNRYIAYISSFDDDSATFKGITDVNLMILKVASDGTISSAIPGKTVQQAMTSAKEFKAQHPDLRVNICVLGVDGWESYVESSAYVSRINKFSQEILSLAASSGLDGIDLYVAGPTSVNFANLCKAINNLMDGKKTDAGKDYTFSLTLCSEGNSLELTSCGTLKDNVDYFNIMGFDYGEEATGQLMSATINTYLEYGLSASTINFVLSASEVNAELAADICSVAYANGLAGVGVVGYSSDPAVSQMTSIMIYVFENGINIIVKGDMAAFPLHDLGEYDRDRIIVVCTIGDDIYPVPLSHFNTADSNLYYHVMYEEGFFSAYYVNVSFGDVLGTTYCDAIQYCCARGLFDMDGDGFFHGDRAMTNREALAAVCRLTTDIYDLDLNISFLPADPTPDPDSTDDVTTFTPAPQVDKDSYYAPIISWAVSKGLVSQDSVMVTNPEGNVTRQDMANLLEALADYMGHSYYEADGEWTTSNTTISRGESAMVFREYIESYFIDN